MAERADARKPEPVSPTQSCDVRPRAVGPLVTARVDYMSTRGLSHADALAITSPFVWALHANTSLALFWLLAHAAADTEQTREAILAEVDAAWTASGGDVNVLSKENLDTCLPLLTSACWEVLRLYSYAFGARAATADVDIPLAQSDNPAGKGITPVHLHTPHPLMPFPR